MNTTAPLSAHLQPLIKSSVDKPDLVTHKTMNKVQKILVGIAKVAGSLSIAMPLTLLVSFASGTSAGLSGSAALAALCLPVLKALGVATIAALGTVGTFGLMCAIPIAVVGLSLLILHFYNPTKTIAEPAVIAESVAIAELVFETRSPGELTTEWNKHSQSISEIVCSWMTRRPNPDFISHLTRYLISFRIELTKLIHARLNNLTQTQLKKIGQLKLNKISRFQLDEPILTSAFIYLEKLVHLKKITVDENNVFKYLAVCLRDRKEITVTSS